VRYSPLLERQPNAINEDARRLARLKHTIERAAHVLPSQGPISVFVHHNTLHAFEDLNFHDALKRGAATYGCEPYLSEDRYLEEFARGRMLPDDVAAVLLEDLDDRADGMIGPLGTRFYLRLAMLQFPLRLGSDAELHWLIAEANALTQFRSDAPPPTCDQMVDRTRHWIMRDFRDVNNASDRHARDIVEALFSEFDKSSIEHWSTTKWEAFTLHLLWRVCYDGIRTVKRSSATAVLPVRHRDLLLLATGRDADLLVHELLIRFCAAFLDQGLAPWGLPNRDEGFFRAFSEMYRSGRPLERWLRFLPAELARIERAGVSPLQCIDESVRLLGIAEPEQQEFIAQSLLVLRGWAGMLWQMETNAEWTVRPAPHGTLVEYLAIRLILDRLAARHLSSEFLNDPSDLIELRTRLGEQWSPREESTVYQRAFLVFQLSQVLGWDPEVLSRLTAPQWSKLVEEIEAFSDVDRRRVLHGAYERRYRNQTLDALTIGAQLQRPSLDKPAFQVICCLDEREESFRRHLEEVAPECETLSLAGFFGVAMYYRGAGDAHYKPLCPVIVKPQHFVEEEVVYSLAESHRRRALTRQVLGKATHWLHIHSRSVVAGMFTAILGSMATAPLVARVLFPRVTARLRRAFGSVVQPPPVTRLVLERTKNPPGPEAGHVGYLVEEMSGIVERMLRDAGLVTRFGRLVIMMGHGSSSLNNPHEPAHDCGACGGARGGPNARAFAEMANDPRIRRRLAAQGIRLPEDTYFIGAYHNTCDDSVRYFDLDFMPPSHRKDFEMVKERIDEARRRNAHERCRRFDSAELSLSPDAALRHVEGRAEDLSQVRPEYGHATNAVVFVGRRSRTRGLFLDRRNFLTSYEPTLDDDNCTVLTRILQAAIPVCAGISLEYYFSVVDPTGYGCGTKLPHNVTSLLGVMNGAASDLRPGLPWQMVEIHEPVRCLFVIETAPKALCRVFDRHPALGQLCHNEWIQLATLDPDSPTIHVYQKGRFERYVPETTTLPVVTSSVDWYRGWRDHLGYAIVQTSTPAARSEDQGAA
jgi:uncharacterized protein YbcC (UPF0753/DUF2309 family)